MRNILILGFFLTLASQAFADKNISSNEEGSRFSPERTMHLCLRETLYISYYHPSTRGLALSYNESWRQLGVPSSQVENLFTTADARRMKRPIPVTKPTIYYDSRNSTSGVCAVALASAVGGKDWAIIPNPVLRYKPYIYRLGIEVYLPIQPQ